MIKTLLLVALAVSASAVQAQVASPTSNTSARLQVLHLADDPSYETVDVYVNGELIASGLPYEHATAALDVEVTDAVVSISKSGADAEDRIASVTVVFENGLDYQVIFDGKGIFENQGGATFGGGSPVTVMSAPQPSDDEVSIVYVHNTATAIAHDVRLGSTAIAAGIAYGQISGALRVPAADAVVALASPVTNRNMDDALFQVFVGEFPGQSLTLIATDGAGELPKRLLLVTGSGETFEFSLVNGRGTVAVAPLGLEAAVRVGGPAPNPFSGATALGLDLDAPADVAVEVFDVQGRRVVSVAPVALGAGTHRLPVAVEAGPGVYLYRVTIAAQGAVVTRSGRMVSVR